MTDIGVAMMLKFCLSPVKDTLTKCAFIPDFWSQTENGCSSICGKSRDTVETVSVLYVLCKSSFKMKCSISAQIGW